MVILKNKYAYSWLGWSLLMAVLNACAYTGKATGEMLREARKKKYDLVIVPGVPLENGKWSRLMKARVYWSKYLYDHGIAKNIMYSGSAVYTPYVEAEVMAMYAQAIGIEPGHIYTETKAEHSTENVYYSFHKAQNLGFTTIALASDPFQTKMLHHFVLKNINQGIGFIPIVYDTLRAMEPYMIDPEIDYTRAFENGFVPLTEREGFWKRLKGTRGSNIDPNAY